EEKFKEAAEAYEILSNPEKKARYDQFGHAGNSASGFGGGGMNMEDIFSQFGDIFGGGHPFESFFGGGGRSGGRRVQKGTNLRIKVKFSLEENAKRVEKINKVNNHVHSGNYNGTEAMYKGSYNACKTCGGSGSVRRVTNTILGQM